MGQLNGDSCKEEFKNLKETNFIQEKKRPCTDE